MKYNSGNPSPLQRSQPICGYKAREQLVHHYLDWFESRVDGSEATPDWQRRHRFRDPTPGAITDLLRPLIAYKKLEKQVTNSHVIFTSHSVLYLRLKNHMITRLDYFLGRIEKLLARNCQNNLSSSSSSNLPQAWDSINNSLANIAKCKSQLSTLLLGMLKVIDLDFIKPLAGRILVLISLLGEEKFRLSTLLSNRSTCHRHIGDDIDIHTDSISKAQNSLHQSIQLCPTYVFIMCLERLKSHMQAFSPSSSSDNPGFSIGSVYLEVATEWMRHCMNLCECKSHMPLMISEAIASTENDNIWHLKQFCDNSALPKLQQIWFSGRPDQLLLFLLRMISNISLYPIESSLLGPNDKLTPGFITEISALGSIVESCVAMYHLVKQTLLFIHHLSLGSSTKTSNALIYALTHSIKTSSEKPASINSPFYAEDPIGEIGDPNSSLRTDLHAQIYQTIKFLFSDIYFPQDTFQHRSFIASQALSLRIALALRWKTTHLSDFKGLETKAVMSILTVIEKFPSHYRENFSAVEEQKNRPKGSSNSLTLSQTRQFFLTRLPTMTINRPQVDLSRANPRLARLISNLVLYDFFAIFGSDNIVAIQTKCLLGLVTSSQSSGTFLSSEKRIDRLVAIFVLSMASSWLLQPLELEQFISYSAIVALSRTFKLADPNMRSEQPPYTFPGEASQETKSNPFRTTGSSSSATTTTAKFTPILFNDILQVLIDVEADVGDSFESRCVRISQFIADHNLCSEWEVVLEAIIWNSPRNQEDEESPNASYGPIDLARFFFQAMKDLKLAQHDDSIKQILTRLHNVFHDLASQVSRIRQQERLGPPIGGDAKANNKSEKLQHIKDLSILICFKLWRTLLTCLMEIMVEAGIDGGNSPSQASSGGPSGNTGTATADLIIRFETQQSNVVFSFLLAECRSDRFFNGGCDGLPGRVLDVFYRVKQHHPVFTQVSGAGLCKETVLRWIADLIRSSSSSSSDGQLAANVNFLAHSYDMSPRVSSAGRANKWLAFSQLVLLKRLLTAAANACVTNSAKQSSQQTTPASPQQGVLNAGSGSFTTPSVAQPPAGDLGSVSSSVNGTLSATLSSSSRWTQKRRSISRTSKQLSVSLFEWTVEEKSKLNDFLKKRCNDQVILEYLRAQSSTEEVSPNDPQSDCETPDHAEIYLNIIFGYYDMADRANYTSRHTRHPGIALLTSSLRAALDL